MDGMYGDPHGGGHRAVVGMGHPGVMGYHGGGGGGGNNTHHNNGGGGGVMGNVPDVHKRDKDAIYG